jgi:hypothetical protein
MTSEMAGRAEKTLTMDYKTKEIGVIFQVRLKSGASYKCYNSSAHNNQRKNDYSRRLAFRFSTKKQNIDPNFK